MTAHKFNLMLHLSDKGRFMKHETTPREALDAHIVHDPRRTRAVFATVFATVSLPLLAANQSLFSEVEFDANAPLTTIIIDGRATTMEVAPDGPGSPIITSTLAQELGMRGSMVRGEHRVGRTAIPAKSNMARIDYGDGDTVRNRLFWFQRDWNDVAEGRIGPTLIPAEIVTYRLGEQTDTERTITLPLIEHQRAGLRTQLELGDVVIPAVFTFDRAETMITASTGALLAMHYDGAMTGPEQQVQLEMGFARPIRLMEFKNPVLLGNLTLDQIVVRTTETGSTGDIPDELQDPNEIVVSASSNRKPTHGIYIGLGSLRGCSRLTFDKPAKEVRLSCR